MKKNREVKYFLFNNGAIGVEIYNLLIYVSLHERIVSHDTRPVVLFITKSSNEILTKLIKRKFDELGIEYKDLNSYTKIKSVRKYVFSNLLSFAPTVADCAYNVGSSARFIDNLFNIKSIRDKYKYINSPLNPMEFDYFNNKDARLEFNNEENTKGIKKLFDMGVNASQEYVCVHARDGAYADALGAAFMRNNDNARNSSFKTYLPSCAYMSSKNIVSLRMGSVQEYCDESYFTDGVIDYSGKYRSEFMDVWLMSKAKFIIGNSSGFNMLGCLFGDVIPLIWADAGSILSSTPSTAKDLYIPQRLWLKGEKRFLTFAEIAEQNIGFTWESYLYEKHNVEVIKSSEYEILEATKEMNDVVDGNYIYSEEDNFLLQKWRSAFKLNQAPKHTPSRVSMAFLRENKKLYM